jgi:hypothetical protein
VNSRDQPSKPICSKVDLNDIGQYAAAYTIGPDYQRFSASCGLLDQYIPSTAMSISRCLKFQASRLTTSPSLVNTHYPFFAVCALVWFRVIGVRVL